MAKKIGTSRIVWLRRFIQTVFLVLFFYLFIRTVYLPINETDPLVELFFNLDPLVAFNTWLAAHTFVSAMLLSLATLVVTVLAGRWFCGWICPFGAIHTFFSSLRGGRAKQKIEAGGYNRWQKAKYYGLFGFLTAALVGVNVVGWLDPFSFLFRSITTAVYPVFSSATVSLFTWIYYTDPGIGPVRLTLVTEPIYEVLRTHVLPTSDVPPQYAGGLLIGLLFGGVVALNFFRARFWCRYICPLGALLGFVGKNPLVRVHRNEEQCNDCGLCMVNCQGGASPNSAEWKPAECLYCWNCKSDCPSQAITFGLPARREKNREDKQDELVSMDS